MNYHLYLILSFCFLSICNHLEAYKLSICAIFKDEAPFLEEWIVFHKVQGVEHFYLYNNNSTDNFQKVLQPYVDANEVTLIDWNFDYNPGQTEDWGKIQTGAYSHCLEKFGDISDWIAFLDADEYLFCPTGETLPQFLERYQDYGGVCANWLVFGTSGIEDIPENSLMIEHLVHCGNYDCTIVKSIAQPKYVKTITNPHFLIYKEGSYAVDSLFRVVPDAISKEPCLDSIRINHYWTRTEKYFREVKVPSRMRRRSNETLASLKKLADNKNANTDFSILQFVPAMKALMNINQQEEKPCSGLNSQEEKNSDEQHQPEEFSPELNSQKKTNSDEHISIGGMVYTWPLLKSVKIFRREI